MLVRDGEVGVRWKEGVRAGSSGAEIGFLVEELVQGVVLALRGEESACIRDGRRKIEYRRHLAHEQTVVRIRQDCFERILSRAAFDANGKTHSFP